MKNFFLILIILFFGASAWASSQLSTSEIGKKPGGVLTEEEKLLIELRAKDNRNLALKDKESEEAGYLSRAGKNAEARELSRKIFQRDIQLIEEYEKFLKKYPESYAGHNDLGNLFYDLGRPYSSKAYEHWLKAASINPDFAPAHSNIGVWHSHYGSPEVAIRETVRAIELGPQQASFHFNLATYCYTFRPHALKYFKCELPALYEMILKEHKYSVQLAPRDYDYAYQYAYTFFGYDLFKTRLNWKEAEDAWLYLLKLRPLKAREFYYFLTMLAINAGYREQAEKYMKLLKTVDPSEAPEILNLEKRLEKMRKK